MRHLLALILIAVLMLSHGSMGVAMPHGEHRDHVHEMTVDVDQDDHHTGTESVVLADQEPVKAIGHGSHIHLAGVVARADGSLPAPVPMAGSTYVAVDDPPPPTRRSSPLLEPPAA